MNRFALFALGALTLTACDTAEPEPVFADLEVETATDIEADPTTGRDPVTGAPFANGLFTLYDLDAGEVVLSSSETDASVRAADSTSTAWDFGLRGTTFIFNGGTSGPGQGAAQIVAETFSAVTEAPADGYVVDGSNTCPSSPFGGPGEPLAICTGSDNGWYNYDRAQNLISPLSGRTIVLRTGDGNYAKIRILSYYQGAPNPPDPNAPGRYYTFEYVVQPDGTRDFTRTEVEG